MNEVLLLILSELRTHRQLIERLIGESDLIKERSEQEKQAQRLHESEELKRDQKIIDAGYPHIPGLDRITRDVWLMSGFPTPDQWVSLARQIEAINEEKKTQSSQPPESPSDQWSVSVKGFKGLTGVLEKRFEVSKLPASGQISEPPVLSLRCSLELTHSQEQILSRFLQFLVPQIQ